MDLSAADKLICFRPQSHLVPHENKTLWFIHHVRVFYDLWESQYRTFPANSKYKAIRNQIINADSAALLEAKHVFTNSKVVQKRLLKFNEVESAVLYPPLLTPDKFFNNGFDDSIVYVSRVEHHKRQHLLIEALRYTKTNVRVSIFGVCSNPNYEALLKDLIRRHHLQDRVLFDNRWISETEKIQILSTALGIAYLPFDEDSYGYPSLEAGHSEKAVLTTTDSGGVLELVSHYENGLVAEPNPKHLAECMDELFLNRNLARSLGKNALKKIESLDINWDNVINKLTQ
jgi:glycosyltransferase involved in cell wall biosynthesis